MPWKKRFFKTAAVVDEKIDRIKLKLYRQFGMNRPLQIVPYRSYGTSEHIFVKGRVLADKTVPRGGDKDSRWKNLVNMYLRFESDEVPGVPVALITGGNKYETTSDNEGYFHFDNIPTGSLAPDQLYYNFNLSIPIEANDEEITATAEVLIPPSRASYGIISDIDDTVIQTKATNLFQMGKTVLLGNARTRLPFEGVSAFYAALQLGLNKKAVNPFFYVSSSPWNLYDLITDFMDLHSLPQGPLMLRDFGIRSDTFINKDYLGHKLQAISSVLNTYPELPFILIGDSGEEDPAIYLEVVKNFPGRIKAIYIREIGHPAKIVRTKEYVTQSSSLSVEMVLTPDSHFAMQHAKANGFIV